MRPITLSALAVLAISFSLQSSTLSQTIYPVPNSRVVLPPDTCCGGTTAAPKPTRIYYPHYQTLPQHVRYYGQPIPAQQITPSRQFYTDTVSPTSPLTTTIQTTSNQPLAIPTVFPQPATTTAQSIVNRSEPTPVPPIETQATTVEKQVANEAVEEVIETKPLPLVRRTVSELKRTYEEPEVSKADEVVDYSETVIEEEATEIVETAKSDNEFAASDEQETALDTATETKFASLPEETITESDAFETHTKDAAPSTIETAEVETVTEPVIEAAPAQVAQPQPPQRVREIPKRQVADKNTAGSRRTLPVTASAMTAEPRKPAAPAKTVAETTTTNSPAVIRNASQPAGWNWWMAAPLALLPIGWMFFKGGRRQQAVAATTETFSEPKSSEYVAATETKRAPAEYETTTPVPPVAAAATTTPVVSRTIQSEIQPQRVAPEAVAPTANVKEAVAPVAAATTAAAAIQQTNAAQSPVNEAAIAPATPVSTQYATKPQAPSGVTQEVVAPASLGSINVAGTERRQFTEQDSVTPQTQQAGSTGIPAPTPVAATTQQSQGTNAVSSDISPGMADINAAHDDFTVLEGVTPGAQQALNAAGYYRYSDLVDADPNTIQWIFSATIPQNSHFQAEDWLAQAKVAARGDWTSLSQMQKHQPAANPSQQLGTTADRSTTGTATEAADFSQPANSTAFDQNIATTGGTVRDEASHESTDDLTRIKGIGPATMVLLRTYGVRTYKELAATSQTRLTEILREGGSSFGPLDPSTWASQAAYAAQGDWNRLAEFTDSPETNLLNEANAMIFESDQLRQQSQAGGEDLTQIRGIAPATATVLQVIGIRTVADLASADVTFLENALAKYGTRFQNANPSDWLEQAKSLASPTAAKARS